MCVLAHKIALDDQDHAVVDFASIFAQMTIQNIKFKVA